jgi:S-adenosylmethionine decarboxylase
MNIMDEEGTIKFGVHYMLDGYGANPDKLKDKESLTQLLKELPLEMDMHPISEAVVVEVGPNNKKDPGGVSGFVMIAESHISFHTFPGRGFVTIDAYTCNDTIPEEELTVKFKEYFEFSDLDVQVIDRGTKYPADDLT